jgi:endonuclease YncB( thermonuclease family)
MPPTQTTEKKMTMTENYFRNCTLDRVIDGDTIDVTIDLGWGITIRERVRLAAIDTPETRTRDLAEKADGLAAKQFVENWFGWVRPLTLHSHRFDRGKYGRTIGDFWRGDDPISLVEALRTAGHAK